MLSYKDTKTRVFMRAALLDTIMQYMVLLIPCNKWFKHLELQFYTSIGDYFIVYCILQFISKFM